MLYNQPHLARRSRRPWTGRASLIALAGCLNWAVVWSTAAQDDCFRVVDIVELGFIPNPNDITFGLNDQHEAVGTYEVGGEKHAFLWLPAPAHNLTEGFHDLHTLADLDPDDDESAAFDINDAGIAVGWVNISGNQVAVVWEIDDYDPAFPPLTYINLSTYTAPNDGAPDIEVPTVAWAISDDTPPVVVGDANGLSDCNCPPDNETTLTILGFRAVLDGADLLEELLPILIAPCDYLSYGRDINSVATPLAVGYSDGGSPCAPDISDCDLTKDAVHFSSGGVPTALADLSAGGSETRGVNDNGSIIGWGFASDLFPCKMSALFWATSASAEFDLGSVSGIDPVDETRAEAITEPDGGGDMIVVGSNDTTDHALRWEGSGLTWTVVDLNDKIVGACADADGFVPVVAFDVNQDGWIIALADNDPGTTGIQAGAILLAPDQSCTACCFADLDCSGNVGASDLLAILAAWGPCAGCPADLDCNGVVGANDLLNLLAAWDTCDMTPPTEIPRTVQDCFDKFFPDEMAALIACIEAIE